MGLKTNMRSFFSKAHASPAAADRGSQEDCGEKTPVLSKASPAAADGGSQEDCGEKTPVLSKPHASPATADGGSQEDCGEKTPVLAITDHSTENDSPRGYNGTPLGKSHAALEPAYTTTCWADLRPDSRF